jgi:hypothetical protein
MNGTERINELMARAERLGLRLAFDSGLITVCFAAAGDLDRQRELVGDLAKYLPEVRTVLEGRAVALRTRKLLGRPVWSAEYGEGTVAGAEAGSGLTISFQTEASRRPLTIVVSADSVVIVRDEEVDGAATPIDDESKTEKPPKGFFDQLLRRGREN